LKEISDFISNVGFPIFIALLMMYQNQNFNKMYQETVEKFGDKLESNTALLEKIWDGISKDWSGNK